jgi:hypothetical protein
MNCGICVNLTCALFIQGEHRAEMFVLDFIVPQLVGKDINELWTVDNPMGLLAALLKVITS